VLEAAATALLLYFYQFRYTGFRWSVLWVPFVAALVAVAASYSFSSSLAGRLHRLRRVAEDLVERPSLDERLSETDDELGQLARALDRAGDRLRELSTRLSLELTRRDAMLSSMVEGVLTVDDELRVTFCNDSFRRLVGIAASITEPVPLVELVRDSQLTEMFRQVLASGHPVNQRLELAAADSRIFDTHAAPLSNTQSGGAIAILHDITELERLERVRKDFVANVSHELRTPLTAICGYAEALLEGGLEDQANNRKFLEIINAHAHRINNIASDLLTLSELESAKPLPEPDRIAVRSALEAALRGAEPEAKMRNVRLICGRMEDATVMGFKIHFEQAILNLLQNAVKFNHAGGEVRLDAARSQDGKICITVADTGIGIPSEDLSRIFERFYRVDRARSREVSGTGLGLSIVKHVIERMDGTIAVESQLGKGSTFKLSLPCC
jgi:two-component system phosphate regulon sensor histidine kinase PhoR